MIPSPAWRYWRLNDTFCSEHDSDAAATVAAKIANTLPLTLGDLHLTHGFVGHPSLQSKWHVDRYSRFCTTHRRRVSHYFTVSRYVFPKNAPSPWGIGSPSNTWYLGPIWVINPNGISIGSAVFVWVPNAMLHSALSLEKNKIAPSPWDFVTPPEEDRAMAKCFKNVVKIARMLREVCLPTDRQTDRQTHRRAHYSTSPPLPRAK